MNFDIDPSLKSFFAPGGIVLVGATNNPTKLGYGLARNLLGRNFPGEVHFVTPKGGTLLGRSIYTSIMVVPEPLDLAVILVPAQGVPQILRDCGRRGISAAIINSGGFRETGAAGAALEEECLSIARKYKIPGSAGSDAHTLQEIGNAYIEMPDFNNKDEFLQSLSRGRIVGHRSNPLVHFNSLANTLKNHFK